MTETVGKNIVTRLFITFIKLLNQEWIALETWNKMIFLQNLFLSVSNWAGLFFFSGEIQTTGNYERNVSIYETTEY